MDKEIIINETNIEIQQGENMTDQTKQKRKGRNKLSDAAVKEHRKITQKKYRSTPEARQKHIEYMKTYNKTQKHKEGVQRYYQKHKEEIKRYAREWYKLNKEKRLMEAQKHNEIDEQVKEKPNENPMINLTRNL